jgi:hypothetical protein
LRHADEEDEKCDIDGHGFREDEKKRGRERRREQHGRGRGGAITYNCEEGGSGGYRRCEVGTLRCHTGASDTGVVLGMEATGVKG